MENTLIKTSALNYLKEYRTPNDCGADVCKFCNMQKHNASLYFGKQA